MISTTAGVAWRLLCGPMRWLPRAYRRGWHFGILEDKAFTYSFEFDPAIRCPLVVFVPRLHYPNGVRVTVSSGKWELDSGQQQLAYYPEGGRGLRTLRLAPGVSAGRL